MATNIKKLLSKSGWTGDEVGKAIITNLLHDIKNIAKQHEPLFKQEELTRMVDSLTTERDCNIYNFYQNLNTGIVDAYNRGLAYNQQFQNGFFRLLYNMRQYFTAEQALKQEAEKPLIMTQAQYERYYHKAEKTKKDLSISFIGVMLAILEYYANNPEEAPEDIRKAIEATENEPLTNKAILSSYNKIFGEGYYTLPDGRNGANLDLAEWQAMYEECYLKTHKYEIDGVQQSYEETQRHFEALRMIKANKMFFKGEDGIRQAYKEYYGEDIPEEKVADYFTALQNFVEASYRFTSLSQLNAESKLNSDVLEDEIIKLLDGKELAFILEWTPKKEPPEDLKKYDPLLDVKAYYSLEGIENIELEDIQPFIEDYPELYKLLEAYIKKTIPQLAKLKPNQYGKRIISWEALAELNIANYKELVAVDDEDIRTEIAEDKNAEEWYEKLMKSRNGIAIIQNPKSYLVDENGDYIDRDKGCRDIYKTIERIDEATERELDISLNTVLKPALRFIIAYNTLLELMADNYAISNLEEAQIDLQYYQTKLDAYNGLLSVFYSDVYGTQDEKARKRKRIKETFKLINTDELQPTDQAKEKIKEELGKITKPRGSNSKLRDFQHFISILTEGGL